MPRLFAIVDGHLPRALFLGALWTGFSAGVCAAQGQERLIELDQIAISHDLCGFALSDEQAGAVKSQSDQVIESLQLDPDEAQKLYDQYAEAMRRQKATGLCDPKGEWARTYGQLVAALGR